MTTLDAPGAMVDPCRVGVITAPGQPMCCTGQQKRRSGRSGGAGSAYPLGAMVAPGYRARCCCRARCVGCSSSTRRQRGETQCLWHGVAAPCQLASRPETLPSSKQRCATLQQRNDLQCGGWLRCPSRHTGGGAPRLCRHFLSNRMF